MAAVRVRDISDRQAIKTPEVYVELIKPAAGERDALSESNPEDCAFRRGRRISFNYKHLRKCFT